MALRSERSTGRDELACLSEPAGAVDDFLPVPVDPLSAGVSAGAVDEEPGGGLPGGAGEVAGA